jgi:hypothetical protein
VTQLIPQVWQLLSFLHWLKRHRESAAEQLLAPRSFVHATQAGDDMSGPDGGGGDVGTGCPGGTNEVTGIV